MFHVKHHCLATRTLGPDLRSGPLHLRPQHVILSEARNLATDSTGATCASATMRRADEGTSPTMHVSRETSPLELDGTVGLTALEKEHLYYLQLLGDPPFQLCVASANLCASAPLR